MRHALFVTQSLVFQCIYTKGSEFAVFAPVLSQSCDVVSRNGANFKYKLFVTGDLITAMDVHWPGGTEKNTAETGGVLADLNSAAV